jgi:hypothetical protein
MSTQINIRLRMVHAVARAADQCFADRAKELGALAANALGEGHRSQITGLESIANAALKVSDIFDYIKLRTARHAEWRQNSLGPKLLAYLEQDLGRERDRICQELGSPDETLRQEVYLRLIRAFVQQFAAHYEYSLVEKEGSR